mgnify:CR=1 FL=1
MKKGTKLQRPYVSLFQIDFSDKRVSLIERGKIAKAFHFSNFEQYDSEVRSLTVQVYIVCCQFSTFKQVSN